MNQKLISYFYVILFSGLYLSALTTVTGCGFLLAPSGKKGSGEKGLGRCAQNEDCLQGQFCNQLFCIANELKKNQIVSLQVTPPPSLSLQGKNLAITKQQFIRIDAGFVHKGILSTRQAYLVSGVIQSEKQHQPIAAKIRFTDLQSIKNEKLFWEVETDPGQIGRFKLRLSYGTYRIEVYPKNSSLPIHRIPNIKIDRSRQFQFHLPEKEEYLRIKGRLVTANALGVPLKDLKIQALSLKKWVISSTSTTDENGQFLLNLPPNSRPEYLLVQMRKKAPLHPKVLIPYQPDSRKGQVVDLGTLAVGLQGTAIQITGLVRSALQEGGKTVANCRINLIGEVRIGSYKGRPIKGFFRFDVRSDSNGRFKASILPGNYQLEAIPPVGSSWAHALLMYRNENQIQKDQQIEISLKSKPIVTGRICPEKSSDKKCSNGVQGTNVQAIWKSGLNKAMLQSTSFSTFRTATIQANGQYQISLDPGIYDLVFIPPLQSGLARKIYRNVEVRFTAPDVKTNKTQLDALLPKAQYLVAQIMGPDKFPIRNMLVEMFEYTGEQSSPARLLGTAITNSQGFFSIPFRLPKKKK